MYRRLLISFSMICSCFLLFATEVIATCELKDLQEEIKKAERFDDLTESHRSRHSFEWAIDASDVIVVVTIARRIDQIEPEQFLKPVDRMSVSWPPANKERFEAIIDLYEPGDRVVMCLRLSRDAKTAEEKSTLHHYFHLIPGDDPRCSIGRNRFYENLPADMDSTIRMYTYRRAINAGFWHMIVDKEGKSINNPDDLLERIEKRVAAGSRVPPHVDREAVEAGKSVHGGFDTYISLSSELSAAEFPMVLVPPEPELRKYFFNKKGKGLRSVNPNLINYPDDEVVAALKETLKDRNVHQLGFTIATGSLMEQITYELPPGQKPRLIKGELEGKVRAERVFHLRKSAYEMLLKMGHEVKRPKLTP